MSDAAAGPYQVELERFQGPLELLLHLIRRQDLDIFDIPIARVAAQFLEAVRGVRQLPLEHAGEFLEMAATLVRIKAQMLFPRRGDEEEGEDPRAELVRRLLEWEHFRDAAEGLAQAEADSARRFGKGYVAPRPPAPATAAPLLSEWSE
ncbi:MAG: segregation/condensation protein A, partial [Gemmatimonadota bacterium]|nr:segregation/condensation protein A [Gemmatimonadota bacterium]